MLADPAIFVLDEATSSIDTQTEQLIQDAISYLLQNRTSFLIAHRLSTIRQADLILVVRDGKIIEQGLVTRGRKIEFSIQLQDKPGMLEKVSHILASENANVISITYDRMSADLELGETILHIGCEVGGKEHSERVAKALTDSGLKVLENGRGGR